MTNVHAPLAPLPAARRQGPDWSNAQTCRDRAVLDEAGERIGRLDMILRAPDASDEVFCLVVLGSVSRLGNEARAIPARLLAEPEPDGCFVLLCEPQVVRAAPIHVDGTRCACAAWFDRVREHFAAYGPRDSSSGKAPHSSSS